MSYLLLIISLLRLLIVVSTKTNIVTDYWSVSCRTNSDSALHQSGMSPSGASEIYQRSVSPPAQRRGKYNIAQIFSTLFYRVFLMKFYTGKTSCSNFVLLNTVSYAQGSYFFAQTYSKWYRWDCLLIDRHKVRNWTDMVVSFRWNLLMISICATVFRILL